MSSQAAAKAISVDASWIFNWNFRAFLCKHVDDWLSVSFGKS